MCIYTFPAQMLNSSFIPSCILHFDSRNIFSFSYSFLKLSKVHRIVLKFYSSFLLADMYIFKRFSLDLNYIC